MSLAIYAVASEKARCVSCLDDKINLAEYKAKESEKSYGEIIKKETER